MGQGMGFGGELGEGGSAGGWRGPSPPPAPSPSPQRNTLCMATHPLPLASQSFGTCGAAGAEWWGGVGGVSGGQWENRGCPGQAWRGPLSKAHSRENQTLTWLECQRVLLQTSQTRFRCTVSVVGRGVNLFEFWEGVGMKSAAVPFVLRRTPSFPLRFPSPSMNFTNNLREPQPGVSSSHIKQAAYKCMDS